jgi:hypothetical protein
LQLEILTDYQGQLGDVRDVVAIRKLQEWEKNSNGTITTINTESNTEKYSGSSTNTPSLTM